MAHTLDQAAQERAEAKFNKQEEKRRDAEVAMAAYLEEQRAIEEKTARLRAARLAREAQEQAKREAGAADKAPAGKASRAPGGTTVNGKAETAKAAAAGRDLQADIKAQAAAFAAATKRANAAKAKLGIKAKPAAHTKTVASAKKKLSA